MPLYCSGMCAVTNFSLLLLLYIDVLFFCSAKRLFCLLKLDLTLIRTLFFFLFLSVSLSKSEDRALRSLKEPQWRAKWWALFLTVWAQSRLFSSLCLTSLYFGVSLIEGTLSFTSFPYFISWFPVHVEACTVGLWGRPLAIFSHFEYIGVMNKQTRQMSKCKFQSNGLITFIWALTEPQFDTSDSCLCVQVKCIERRPSHILLESMFFSGLLAALWQELYTQRRSWGFKSQFTHGGVWG